MITVVTGTDIEKLKGEFESVINGMNMVGKIPYDVYSELYDVGVDYIQNAYELGKSELEKENAELKELLKDIASSYGSTEVSEAQLYLKIKKAEQFLNSEVEK